MTLNVKRTVEQGHISFALLVFEIEIRGYDAMGNRIVDKNVKPFSFGDSASGKWSKTVNDLPAGITLLEIRFYGNYA